MARSIERKAPRIPSLDGLRGLLLLLVCFAHLLGSPGFLSIGVTRVTGDLGYLAVRFFFVLSGFLITLLLLAEHERTGRIDLGAFYRRRVHRIFPAFYVYLGIITALTALGLAAVPPREIGISAVYGVNYLSRPSWLVGHLWSLSVEEHFYLLWPAALLLLPGVTLEAKRRSAALANLLVIVSAPAVRLASIYLFPHRIPDLGHTTHTVADALAFGCLLASARDHLWADARYRRLLTSPAFVLVPLSAVALNWASPHVRLHAAAGDTLTSLCAALTIDRVVRLPEAWSSRALSAAPLGWIGLRSYSIYLWQQPFLDRAGPHLWQRFPLNLGLTFLFGAISYHLVEQPMRSLSRRRSRGDTLAQSS